MDWLMEKRGPLGALRVALVALVVPSAFVAGALAMWWLWRTLQ